MRAIDADAVPQEFWEYEFDGKWRGCTIKDLLDSQPTIQPKRGKWIKISPANIYECSECGKNVMTNDICAYDFCHGCGADMREVTE